MRPDQGKIAADSIAASLSEQRERICVELTRIRRVLTSGTVREPTPVREMGFLKRLFVRVTHAIGISSYWPMRIRPLTNEESCDLAARLKICSTSLHELGQMQQREHLWRTASVTTNSDECLTTGTLYPSDWEAISLSYRQRVGFICERCGSHAPDGHVHHKVHVAHGGSSDENNLVFLCRHCHALEHPHMRND